MRIERFRLDMVMMLAPLFLFPLVINVRIFPFIAPNEEPKWAVFILSVLLVSLAAALILWRRRDSARVTVSIPALLLILFYLLLAVGVFIGVNPVDGVVRFVFWLSAAVVWCVAVWAARHKEQWNNWLAWALTIGSAIFSLRYWWSYMLDYGKPGYNVGVLFSPIGHVNFTGDALIILLPALVWLLSVRREPVLKVLNWFSVTTIIIVLLVASSRGALAGLALGLTLLLPFLAREAGRWLNRFNNDRKRIIPFVWVGSAILASILVYNLLPYHYRELARLSGTLETGFKHRELTTGVEQPQLAGFWMGLSPWLGDRTPIFACSTAMAFDAPLLGYGTGNFPYIYPAYSNRYPDFLVPLSSEKTFITNPHNIFFQLSTQNGIPAALIFIGLLVLFLMRILRSLWEQWDSWTVAALVAMSAAIFDSMFNHVFFNPASMFLFALLGGSWWGYVVKRETVVRTVSVSALLNRPLAALLVAAAIALSFWPVRWLVSEWDAGYATGQVNNLSVARAYYDRAYAWDRWNFRAVFGVGEVAYRQRRYADAIRLFTWFESIYPYNPPAVNMLGAAYMMNGQLREAESAFQRTIKMLPSFTMARQNLMLVQSKLRSRSQPSGVPTPWQSK